MRKGRGSATVATAAFVATKPTLQPNRYIKESRYRGVRKRPHGRLTEIRDLGRRLECGWEPSTRLRMLLRLTMGWQGHSVDLKRKCVLP
ncbi:hypothetical protein GQ457_16G013080 [Hibiscus cannabinus]